MHVPRLRFTVRRMMVAVAISAPIAAIGVRTYAACRTSGHPVDILTAVLVTGLVGLLALRKPIVAIPFVILVYLLTPAIATIYRANYYDLPSQGATLAWSVCAPVGCGLKLIRNAVRTPPVVPNPPEPE
jgi:hypothetical protein